MASICLRDASHTEFLKKCNLKPLLLLIYTSEGICYKKKAGAANVGNGVGKRNPKLLFMIIYIGPSSIQAPKIEKNSFK